MLENTCRVRLDGKGESTSKPSAPLDAEPWAGHNVIKVSGNVIERAGMSKPVLALIVFTALASAQFDAPFIIQANGVNLVADIICDPVFTDWNGDGLNDLVIGQFSQGKIRFYPNSGTIQNPVFTTFSYLQADGADITCSYG